MSDTYQARAEELAAELISLSLENVEASCTNDQDDIDLRIKDYFGNVIAVGEVSIDADEDMERFQARYRRSSFEIFEPRLNTAWSMVLKSSFRDFNKTDSLVNLILEMVSHDLDDSDWAIGEWGNDFRERINLRGISSIRDSRSLISPGKIYLFTPIQAGVLDFSNQDFDDWIQEKLESSQFLRKANQLITDPVEARHLVIVMGSGTPWQLTSALMLADTNRVPTPRKRPQLNVKIQGLWILATSGKDWFYWSRETNCWRIYRVSQYPTLARFISPGLIIECE